MADIDRRRLRQSCTNIADSEVVPMKNLSYMALGLILGALAALTAQRATAQDPVRLSPQYYSVRFENDRVRVLEYHLKPGEKEPMHSHPPGVVYVLTEALMKSTDPSGDVSQSAGVAGQVLWRESTIHAVENLGATEARALAVELKPCRGSR
jgi:hypothetical protein